MIRFLDNARQSAGDEIVRRLAEAQWALFAVAFVRESGVDVLDAAIKEILGRGGKLEVLFGNAFGITEASAIRRLQGLGAELRYHRGADTFHVKGYLFGTAAITSAIIGSSNLSRSGLTTGVEWSVAIELADGDLSPMVDAARRLWGSPDSLLVTEAIIAEIDRDARRVDPTAHHQDQATASHTQAPAPRQPGATPTSQRKDQATTSANPAAPKPIIKFRWKVNGTFLNWAQRPITIPQQFNPDVCANQLGGRKVRIHGPGGEQLRGRISRKSANNTTDEYYQIKTWHSDDDPLSRLPLGHELVVKISKQGEDVEVHLSSGSAA